MIELAVGTRFYYKGKLCEVSDEECARCMNCVNDNDVASCRLFACEQKERKGERPLAKAKGFLAQIL